MEQYWVTRLTGGSNKYEIFCVGLDAPPPALGFHFTNPLNFMQSGPYSDLVVQDSIFETMNCAKIK